MITRRLLLSLMLAVALSCGGDSAVPPPPEVSAAYAALERAVADKAGVSNAAKALSEALTAWEQTGELPAVSKNHVHGLARDLRSFATAAPGLLSSPMPLASSPVWQSIKGKLDRVLKKSDGE